MFQATRRNNLINDLDFSPDRMLQDVNLHSAMALIERAIIEGSGGAENVLMTRAGLRFVRYLLSFLGADNFNSLPNFKNAHAIKQLVDLFIERTGSAEEALNQMYRLIQEK